MIKHTGRETYRKLMITGQEMADIIILITSTLRNVGKTYENIHLTHELMLACFGEKKRLLTLEVTQIK